MATKIRLLPEAVANQIAAGEVVERPASVVKELLENALDAGAQRIVIELEQGGRRLIRVTDDGEGMAQDDALLSLERHATSKIRSSRDLFSIQTLGFRGEALPSIASVSELTLTTRDAESLAGTRIVMEGGIIRSVTEIGFPRGTEVTVRRLFANVPARRKFLKSVATELGHITYLTANMALARPDVSFTLIHNGHVLFDLPASRDLSDRLRHALGADPLPHLVPLNRVFEHLLPQGPLHLHGFISLPSYTRTSTRSLHVFVNRRFVRDRLINHAVFEAYRPVLPRGRYPLVVLFLDLPAEAVDVNVHPAKHEVRFQEQAAVHGVVMDTILDTLRAAEHHGTELPTEQLLSLPVRRPLASVPETSVERVESFLPPGERKNSEGIPPAGVRAALERWFEKQGRREEIPSRPSPFSSREKGRRAGEEKREAAEEESSSVGVRRAEQETLLPRPSFSSARIIGQAAGMFILAETDDALLIIDQHAAHERVIFEKIQTQFREEGVVRQPLLFPITVELTLQEAEEVARHQEMLLRLGLEIEPFGGGTVAIKSMPGLLGAVDPGALLVEVVDCLAERRGGGAAVEKRLEEVFAVMACHSVVRAHESLSEEEMRSLLAAMEGAKFAGHCPHGRQVVIRIPFRQMEKWFERG